MKIIKHIIASAFGAVIALSAIPANGSVSAECSSYTDCDQLVACELYTEFDRAQSGLSPDWNAAVARAAKYRTTCANYPDLFKNDINVVLSNNPEIRMQITWATVRTYMNGIVPIDNSDSQIIQAVVNVLGPDTKAQEIFFTDLATAYVRANKRDHSVLLWDDFVLDFLGNDDNLNKYRNGLVNLTGDVIDQDLGINISWDDILVEISLLMDGTQRQYGAMVCENNRSIQVTIDIVGWAITAVAAILTFYAGGAGGAGVAAGRAAIGAGLKTAAKGVAKAGGKVAAKRMSKTAGKMLAKSAVDLGMKANMRGFANYAGKGVLKTGVKHYAKAVGANLAKKKTLLAAGGALVWQLGRNSTAGTIYGLVESDLTKDVVNCHDLDHNEGCYTVCGDGAANDDLNKKVLQPILGKTFCVNPRNYALYEISNNGTIGKPLAMTQDQWKRIKQAISSKVQDKGKCDWNEDDIDMYTGFYMYDPDTLELSNTDLVIEDTIRLDD